MLIARLTTQTTYWVIGSAANRLLKPPVIRFIGSSGHRLSI